MPATAASTRPSPKTKHIRAADILSGAYYKNADGAIYFVFAAADWEHGTRIRWSLVKAAQHTGSINAPSVGDQGACEASVFARRVTKRWTRRCRFCRCTQERACPDGCSWAQIDVCTSCVANLGEPPQ
jgi:hypothetical protein